MRNRDDMGYGLFATADIACGTTVTRYHGVLRTRRFYECTPEAPKTHMLATPLPDYYIDGIRVADEVRACEGFVEAATFILGVGSLTNSADDEREANCAFEWHLDTGDCWLRTRRDVRCGEQLFASYEVCELVQPRRAQELHLLRVYRLFDNCLHCGFVDDMDVGLWHVSYVGFDHSEWVTPKELYESVIPADLPTLLRHVSVVDSPALSRLPRAPPHPSCAETHKRWASIPSRT